MKIQLLEPDGFPAEAIARLTRLGPVTTAPDAATGDVVAVFARLARRLDASWHADYPALRWIVSPTTGLNHIDLDHFARHGIEVLSLRGRTEFLDNIHATAELTLALALALIRDLPAASNAVRDGAWTRYPHKGRELFGKTVLIMGYGRIGRMVAPLYRAFGCWVLAHDTVADRVPAEMRCAFPQTLTETDLLSIHVPLDASTEGLIDRAMLDRLPARAVLVNTARGEVVDQAALLEALEAGRLAGAALDVLVGEPDPLSMATQERLRRLGGRLLVTPHIGGFTTESLETVENYITDLFIAAVDGSV